MYPDKCTQMPSTEGIAIYVPIARPGIYGGITWVPWNQQGCRVTALPNAQRQPYDCRKNNIFCGTASRNERTMKVTTSLASSKVFEGFEGIFSPARHKGFFLISIGSSQSSERKKLTDGFSPEGLVQVFFQHRMNFCMFPDIKYRQLTRPMPS